MLACPPCTGFSRAIAQNHLVNDPRNSLVAKAASFVEKFEPDLFVLENARELLTGKFCEHADALLAKLMSLGYKVDASVHMLTRFGLPQIRERAVVIAARSRFELRTLED